MTTRGNHRLHALCPYFAMFPPSFAARHIRRYTQPRDIVLDCFSGRGTVLLEALLLERLAIACDINPVAFCVSAAKAQVPAVGELMDELDLLEEEYYSSDVGLLDAECSALPTFFGRAFARETLRQLVFLRARLLWRDDRVHRFIAGLLLGHLHGESERSGYYCSNQMPHTISTKPRYSMKYWTEHRLRPPDRDVFDLLFDRAAYRLQEGAPRRRGFVKLCDARIASERFKTFQGQVRLTVTSPPYLDTTRFEEDQWLRLWFLGKAPRPTYHQVSVDDRHERATAYWTFLQEAWQGIAPLLQSPSILVCRLGARGISFADLRDGFLRSVRAVWPRVNLLNNPRRNVLRNRQTAVLHPDSVGCRYEVDFIARLV